MLQITDLFEIGDGKRVVQFTNSVAAILGQNHNKKILLLCEVAVLDGEVCNFDYYPHLNSPALQNVVFPRDITIKSGFGASGGSHFNHPRFQFCTNLDVCLDDGRDLEAWKNNFKFAVAPHHIHFYKGTTYQ